MSSLGVKKTNFNNGGRGPSDVIAFPNLYQVFGSDAANQAATITDSLQQWAESQASNALSSTALKKIYDIQADLIINKNG
jgi:choline dehydrogenase